MPHTTEPKSLTAILFARFFLLILMVTGLYSLYLSDPIDHAPAANQIPMETPTAQTVPCVSEETISSEEEIQIETPISNMDSDSLAKLRENLSNNPPDEPISYLGKLISRSFSYSPDLVIELLELPYKAKHDTWHCPSHSQRVSFGIFLAAVPAIFTQITHDWTSLREIPHINKVVVHLLKHFFKPDLDLEHLKNITTILEAIYKDQPELDLQTNYNATLIKYINWGNEKDKEKLKVFKRLEGFTNINKNVV